MDKAQRNRSALRLLLAFLLSCLALTAQSERGQLTGSITDPTGAMVPGAEIAVLNLATGERRTTASSESGLYTIPLLDPGNTTSWQANKDFDRSHVRVSRCMSIKRCVWISRWRWGRPRSPFA